MPNHMKGCLISLVTGEIQDKTTIKYHYELIRMAKKILKKNKNTYPLKTCTKIFSKFIYNSPKQETI